VPVVRGYVLISAEMSDNCFLARITKHHKRINHGAKVYVSGTTVATREVSIVALLGSCDEAITAESVPRRATVRAGCRSRRFAALRA
jgi:hypothetical protein